MMVSVPRLSEQARFVSLTSPFDRRLGEMLIFPIIKALYFANGDEVHKIVGTGFFVGSRRFLTAGHVFQGKGSAFDVDGEGASGYAVYCVHAVDLNRRIAARHIDVSSISLRRTDIAEGVVEIAQFGKPNPLINEVDLVDTGFFTKFTAEPVGAGTPIYTVAYPLATVLAEPGHIRMHARSDSFSGHVTKHYPSGRDAAMLPWPCYETDMEIKGGASGGPVMIAGSSATIFAVNCTGMEPHTVSHVTSLAPLIPFLIANEGSLERPNGTALL
jgi:hypothetical protein